MIAAWLLLASPSFALAPQFRCVKRLPVGGYDEPPTFEAFMDCQQKAQAASGLKGDALDAFEDEQRAEARGYLSRHTVGAEDAPTKTGTAGLDDGEGGGDGSAAQDDASASMDGGSAQEAGLPAKAVDADTLERLSALRAALQVESDEGQLGVTPQMRDRILAFLNAAEQGQVSPDFKSLLDDAAAEGPNLTADTVKRLARAAAAAEGAGLKIDPRAKSELDSAAQENGGSDGSPGSPSRAGEPASQP